MSWAQFFIQSLGKSIEKYFVSGLVYNASLQKNDWLLPKLHYACFTFSREKFHAVLTTQFTLFFKHDDFMQQDD